MKKSLSLLLSLLLVMTCFVGVFTVSAFAETNLVTDGTFEDYEADTNLAGLYQYTQPSVNKVSYSNISENGWTQTAYALASVSTNKAHEGTKSLKVARSGQAMYKVVDVKAQTEYKYSYWYYQSGKFTGNSNTSVIGLDEGYDVVAIYNTYLIYITDGGTNAGAESNVAYGKQRPLETACTSNNIGDNGVVGEWTKVEFTFNTGNYTRVMLPISCGATVDDELYVDDIVLEEVVYENEGLIEDGSFERYLDGVAIAGTSYYHWVDQNVNAVSFADINRNWTQSAYGKATVTTAQAHSGTKSLNISSPGGHTVYKVVEVKNNTDYTFSFWYYQDGLFVNSVQNFIGIDPNAKQVAIYKTNAVYITEGGTDGGETSDIAYSYQRTLPNVFCTSENVGDKGVLNAWTKVEFKFNSGSNTKLLLPIGATSANTGKLYVDDLVLSEDGKEPTELDTFDGTFESYSDNMVIDKTNLLPGPYHAGASSNEAGWTDKISYTEINGVFGRTFYGKAAVKTTADAYSGNKVLDIDNPNASNGVYVIYDVEPNTDYEVSFWYKQDYYSLFCGVWNDGSLHPTEYNVLGLQNDAEILTVYNNAGFIDTNGGEFQFSGASYSTYPEQHFISTLCVTDNVGSTATLNEWTKAVLSFNSGKYERIAVPFRAQVGAAVEGLTKATYCYIDEVDLHVAAGFDGTFENYSALTISKDNLVPGPYYAGASSIEAGWTDRISYTQINGDFGRTYYGKAAVKTTDDAHSGNKVLDVDNPNGSSGVFVIYDVKPNTEYAVSFWYKQDYYALFNTVWDDNSLHASSYNVLGIQKDAEILTVYNNGEPIDTDGGTFQFTGASYSTYPEQHYISTSCVTNNLALNGVFDEWTQATLRFNSGNYERIAVPFKAHVGLYKEGVTKATYCYVDDIELLDLSSLPQVEAQTTGADTKGGFAKVSFDKIIPEAGDQITYTAQNYDFAEFLGWYKEGSDEVYNSAATFSESYDPETCVKLIAKFNAFAKNLIPDGDFEDYNVEHNFQAGMVYDGKFVTPDENGWALSEQWCKAYALDASYGVAPHTGDKLVGVKSKSNTFSRQVEVEPYTTYKFSFYYYATNGSTLGRVLVNGIDEVGDIKYSNGGPLDEGRRNLVTKFFYDSSTGATFTETVQNNWTKVTVAFDSGSSSYVECHIQARSLVPESSFTVTAGNNTGCYWIDDVSLIEIDDSETGIANGNFDEFDFNYRSSIGTYNFSGYQGIVVGDNNYTVEQEKVTFNGDNAKNAVKISTADAYTELVSVDTYHVQPGGEYMFYAWVKTTDFRGLSFILIEPEYIDKDGNNAYSSRLNSRLNLYSCTSSGASSRKVREDINYSIIVNDEVIANTNDSMYQFPVDVDVSSKYSSGDWTKIGIGFKVPDKEFDSSNLEVSYDSYISMQIGNYSGGLNNGADSSLEIAQIGVEEIVTPVITIDGGVTSEGGYVITDKTYYSKGETAYLSATAYTGSRFVGWFIDGNSEPVSTETEFEYTITGPVSISAKFDSKVENLFEEAGLEKIDSGSRIAYKAGEWTNGWTCSSTWITGTVGAADNGSAKALTVHGRYQAVEKNLTLEANTDYVFSVDYFLPSTKDDESTAFDAIYVVKGDAVYNDVDQYYEDDDIIAVQNFGENPDLDGEVWPEYVLDEWTNAKLSFNTGSNTNVKIAVKYSSEVADTNIVYDNFVLYKVADLAQDADVAVDGTDISITAPADNYFTQKVYYKLYLVANGEASAEAVLFNGTNPVITEDGKYVLKVWTENEEFGVASKAIEKTITKGDIAYTPGDINDDGVVDDKDVSSLRKYLAGWSVTVVEAALDCNGDGNIDYKDASTLAKYLAGWSGVEIY